MKAKLAEQGIAFDLIKIRPTHKAKLHEERRNERKRKEELTTSSAWVTAVTIKRQWSISWRP